MIPSKIWFWGYLHANGTIQVKRWFGDPKDYTDDCDDNPFVDRVVRPFAAESMTEATKIIRERLL